MRKNRHRLRRTNSRQQLREERRGRLGVLERRGSLAKVPGLQELLQEEWNELQGEARGLTGHHGGIMNERKVEKQVMILRRVTLNTKTDCSSSYSAIQSIRNGH